MSCDGPNEIQRRVKPARNPWVFNKFLIIARSASTGNLPRFQAASPESDTRAGLRSCSKSTKLAA
jgi:hypothetical protein